MKDDRIFMKQRAEKRKGVDDVVRNDGDDECFLLMREKIRLDVVVVANDSSNPVAT